MVLNGNRQEEVSEFSEFDTVIVGAGTIGLYMAARLLKEAYGKKICIVESGDRMSKIESNKNKADSVGKLHNGTLNGIYSGLGGGSSIWGGQLAEFEKADFERNDIYWPVSFDEVKSYYKGVYSFLGLKDSLSKPYFDSIYQNGSAAENSIENYYTVRLKDKNTVFTDYFKKEISGDVLTIIINATASKMGFFGSCANELICKTRNGRSIRLKAKKFVFASGTLGINQFFLTTQALYEVPWKQNKLIGQYFQDHLGGVVGRLKIRDEKRFRKSFEKKMIDGIKIERKLTFTKRFRQNFENGAVVFFKYENKEQEYIERFRLFIRDLRSNKKRHSTLVFLKDMFRIRKYLFPFLFKLFLKKQIHETFDENGVLVFVQSEQVPYVNSKITVEKDKLLENGLFKIYVNWDWVGNEIDAIRAITLELRKYLIENGIADIEIEKSILARNPEVLKTFNDTNHQCGGMKMSDSPETGVVDSNCKVWGTDNVWVAGAAVFPSSGHANSTLTALALAERMIQNTFVSD